ncbi:phage portal protein [Paeniglutamicibacter sp.]|uniref:phage portal protein n=1 Tax=Paeniglutamicibacter sp. TaxID=1934391 RepID=UPI00398A1196
MGIIKAASGELVTIHSLGSQSGPSSSLQIIDPGIPRLGSDGNPTDPLTIWKTQPSIRKVVSFAARQFASIPWHAYVRVDDTDRRRKSGSPAENVMGKPAPLISGYSLWNTLAVDRLLYDICLAVLVDGQLVRIPPRLIRIRSDFVGRPVQVLIETPPGMEDLDVTLAPKILAWGWHADKAGGVSPMFTLAGILEENLRSVEWRTAQWENGPKMSGVLTRPVPVAGQAKRWDETQRDRFLEVWKTWRDAPKAGGTPILEDGMEYEQLDGLNPKDAQDIEGRRLTDAEVASAFHIPPELVGARDGTFSNIDAFRQMLFGPTLGPLFQEMQQAVNAGGVVQALDATPRLYLEMNRESAMAGSFTEQARVFQTLTGGPVMTRAEARARLNLPFIEGTDELVVPMNVTEGGQASPTDSGEQNVGGDNADPEARGT